MTCAEGQIGQALRPSRRERVLADFAAAQVSFAVDPKRQAMVDSWPSGVDDSAARRDWGWRPNHDFEGAFTNYLIPAIWQRYGG